MLYAITSEPTYNGPNRVMPDAVYLIIVFPAFPPPFAFSRTYYKCGIAVTFDMSSDCFIKISACTYGNQMIRTKRTDNVT